MMLTGNDSLAERIIQVPNYRDNPYIPSDILDTLQLNKRKRKASIPELSTLALFMKNNYEEEKPGDDSHLLSPQSSASNPNLGPKRKPSLLPVAEESNSLRHRNIEEEDSMAGVKSPPQPGALGTKLSLTPLEGPDYFAGEESDEMVNQEALKDELPADSLNDSTAVPVDNLFEKKAVNLVVRKTTLLRRTASSSALSELISGNNGAENPFARQFGSFNAKGDTNALKFTIYLPFASEPDVPLKIHLKREATVEETIGYVLYEYYNEARRPELPRQLANVAMWNLRIVEDDGEIDEDFPALERTRKIQRFGFDHFALCQSDQEPANFEDNFSMPNDSAFGVADPAASASAAVQRSGTTTAASTTYFLKVHLYSTVEVKQTTTMQAASSMLMSEVFDQICKKRKYDPKDYILKMADIKTDVPMDVTLEHLKATEFCVMKKVRGGAGDIFLRPVEEEKAADSFSTRFLSTDGHLSHTQYKKQQYNVVYKQILSRQQQELTIDGQYLHILSTDEAKFLVAKVKVTYHISEIVSCQLLAKNSTSFKLKVEKGNDSRTMEFEALSALEAAEICATLTGMINSK